MARALEREGWRVDVLADGPQAAAEDVIGQFDLAVLDLGLPTGRPAFDGMRLTARLAA